MNPESDLEQKIVEVLEHGTAEEREGMLDLFEKIVGEQTTRTVADVYERKFLGAGYQD